jgi:hypothetical protein
MFVAVVEPEDSVFCPLKSTSPRQTMMPVWMLIFRNAPPEKLLLSNRR